MPRPGLTALILLGIVVSVLCDLGGSTVDGGRIDWDPAGPTGLFATAVPLADGPADNPRPCTAGSRLIRIAAAGAPDPTVLTPGFDAACDPVLAPAGERLIFRGRERSTDPWRIWELELDSRGDGGPRTLTPADRSCIRPAMLADGGVAFVCGGDVFRTPVETDSDDDPVPVRLTASGGSIQEAVVLPDGRFLLRSTDGAGSPILLTAQPDGTWASRWRDAPVAGLETVRPLPPDRLLLATGGGEGGGLWLGSLDDPFAPLEPVAPEALAGAEIRDPSVLPDGDLLVALRGSGEARFRIVRIERDGDDLTVLAGGGLDGSGSRMHLLQPVAVVPGSPDTRIPSIVKPDLTTGYLVLFDAARSDHPVYRGVPRAAIDAVRIFPWAERASSEEAVDLFPEEDGSLHLEVPADRPLGIVLVGDGGRPLGPPGGPFWVRPNERRACIGCHVSRRYSPPNVRPRALLEPAEWVGWGTERRSPRSELDEGSH